MTGILTYKGELENPKAFYQDSDLPVLKMEVKTLEEIAKYIYSISEASYRGDDPDTFRIKIWESGSEIIVYDNGMDQSIGGGSIVIHISKK